MSRVVEAIEYHLSKKGYRNVEENPDFYVTYHASSTLTVGPGPALSRLA